MIMMASGKSVAFTHASLFLLSLSLTANVTACHTYTRIASAQVQNVLFLSENEFGPRPDTCEFISSGWWRSAMVALWAEMYSFKRSCRVRLIY